MSVPAPLILITALLTVWVVQDYSIPDPELSEKGRQQCIALKESLVPRIPDELDVGLIVVSPMKRTIETALLAFSELIERGIPIVAHADWQETTAKPCDTGSSLESLAAEFPQIDFSKVDPVWPDKTSPAGTKYMHSKQAILARGQSALADLYGRPEKAIIVVSHSGFLRQAVTGCWWINADYRIFDFEEHKQPEDPYVLKEWESTRNGGLGWSWEERVPLGTGLPEDYSPVPQAVSETLKSS